ncbi:MAG: GNAT family N-acetyltransferase [Eubacterium sp.]|nr:GNAT family N-acetyltransferase [Eubacterium sp.]
MVRVADINDAEQLFILNEQFNGRDETTLNEIKESLLNNQQELIIVAEYNNTLVGFVCVQIKKSFCYSDVYAEITEVFVMDNYRRQKIASKMISFAEKWCIKNYKLHSFELLTGKENIQAQLLYSSLGYSINNEILFSKKYE